jgi:hypothetical protein
MSGAAWDTAASHTAPEILRAIGPVDDLLGAIRTGPSHEILRAVRAELTAALEWRRDIMARADATRAAWDRGLDHVAESAEAVATVRACRDAFGPGWRHVLPATAWRARRFVHLDILAAENDPAALAAALERHYPRAASMPAQMAGATA